MRGKGPYENAKPIISYEVFYFSTGRCFTFLPDVYTPRLSPSRPTPAGSEATKTFWSRTTTLAIVRSTINLGNDLGMRIVGEGVEDGPELKSLAQMGCDLVQGFLIARPLGLTALREWLAAR